MRHDEDCGVGIPGESHRKRMWWNKLNRKNTRPFLGQIQHESPIMDQNTQHNHKHININVYVHIHRCICIYIYAHTYVYIIYTHMHICLSVFVYIYIYMCVYIYIFAKNDGTNMDQQHRYTLKMHGSQRSVSWCLVALRSICCCSTNSTSCPNATRSFGSAVNNARHGPVATSDIRGVAHGSFGHGLCHDAVPWCPKGITYYSPTVYCNNNIELVPELETMFLIQAFKLGVSEPCLSMHLTLVTRAIWTI